MTKFVAIALCATLVSFATVAKPAFAFPVIKKVEHIYYSDATFKHQVGYEMPSCCGESCAELQGERTEFVATIKSRCLSEAPTGQATCSVNNQERPCPSDACLTHKSDQKALC